MQLSWFSDEARSVVHKQCFRSFPFAVVVPLPVQGRGWLVEARWNLGRKFLPSERGSHIKQACLEKLQSLGAVRRSNLLFAKQ